MEGMMRCACALCGAAADVHCAADAAFLCAACDAEVHGANFLASRHRRTRVSGAPAKGRDDDLTSSTSCLSTADSATTEARQQAVRTTRHRRTRRGRGEAVLEGWVKQMGVGAARRRATAAACALQHVAVAPRVPIRVAMAAALWREVAARGVQEAQGDALRRLEACAGVPARMIVSVASAIGRGARVTVKRPAGVDVEEGWGDCS